jgi:hypothetical protein
VLNGKSVDGLTIRLSADFLFVLREGDDGVPVIVASGWRIATICHILVRRGVPELGPRAEEPRRIASLSPPSGANPSARFSINQIPL